MSTKAKSAIDSSGAFHPDLEGSSEALRYRPQRLGTDELGTILTCQFVLDDTALGNFPILDLSPTGFAIDPGDDCVLAPGSSVSDLKLSYNGDEIWKGAAQAVYQIGGAAPRTGLRFTTSLFDLQLLRLRDSVTDTRLSLDLQHNADYLTRLPAEWRANVASVRHLLENVKELIEDAESRLNEDSALRMKEEDALFERVFERWGEAFHDQLRALHRESKAFEGSVRELARAYATRELLPLVWPCPMHRRAYEKPLGYAGDYQMMLLMLQKGYRGKSIYSRFLHHVSKNYSFGRMVPAREALIRRAVRETVSQNRPARILSLACGPAFELQNLIGELDRLQSPVEIILVDQSEETMQYCHEAVSRAILKRGTAFASMVNLNCLHLSVRQILQPKGAEERKFVANNFNDVDLVYSVGLYDYLPQSIATRLTRKLYQRLRPSGQLWIGNLTECPDTTWMMEHVLAWHLEYRNHETMLSLGMGLDPEPVERRIVTDDTGQCLFLKAVKPPA